MHFWCINYSWHVLLCRCRSLWCRKCSSSDLWKRSPLLWASSWERELTATLHSEQYSSFLALSSSVSPLAGVTPGAPAGSGFEDPQPGEALLTGWGRGVAGLGMRAAVEGPGESGVEGADTGTGPCATTGLLSCDTSCVSSIKQNGNDTTHYYRHCLFLVFFFCFSDDKNSGLECKCFKSAPQESFCLILLLIIRLKWGWVVNSLPSSVCYKVYGA